MYDNLTRTNLEFAHRKAEKRIEELEKENKLLGERCNQLLKDKGELTDQIGDIKANCDLAIEGRDVKIKELENQVKDLEWQLQEVAKDNDYYQAENKRLEQQIEKMKRHCNCKHRDSEGYCEVKRTYLIDLSYDGCDKWELED